jgi:hypothetical protein
MISKDIVIPDNFWPEGRAFDTLRDWRGGCSCHISPPCGACSNPITEEEYVMLLEDFPELQPKVDFMDAVRRVCK